MHLLLTHKLETALLVFSISLLMAFHGGLLKREFDLLDPNLVSEHNLKATPDAEASFDYSNRTITFTCKRKNARKNLNCGAQLVLTGDLKKGLDFSRYDHLFINATTMSPAVEDRIRISFKNFDKAYSYKDEDLTFKVNAFITQKLVSHGQTMPLGLLRVQQWWLNMFKIPLEHSLPDISNVVTVDLLAMQKGPIGLYETVITEAVIHGSYLSESEVLAITFICALIIASLLFREAMFSRTIASTDTLTGLANREGLNIWLKRLNPSSHKPIDSYLFFIDVDNFKYVNDTFGHKVGDDLLRFISNEVLLKLQQTLTDRSSWLFIRLSGDEFLIIATKINDDIAHTVARNVIKETCKNIKLGDDNINNRISMGVARNKINSVDIRKLMERADVAMYLAKKNGKGQYKFYESNAAIIQNPTLSDLQQALASKHFELRFEPIYEADTRCITSIEVMIHYALSEQENISTKAFLDSIENPTHRCELDKWLLEQVCEFLDENRSIIQNNNIRFLVNISSLFFTTHDFCEYITQLLSQYKVPSSWLSLEINESSLQQNSTVKIRTLDKLKSEGFQLVLDEFGKTPSVLYHLHDCPVEKIKVHLPRSDCKANQLRLNVVHFIAQTYNLEVTAINVDTEKQYQLAMAKGFQRIQGRLFSPSKTKAQIIKDCY